MRFGRKFHLNSHQNGNLSRNLPFACGVGPLTSVKPVFSVSDQQNKHKSADFEQVNDELARGLKLCHSLIDDYRSKLASRLNDNEEKGAANDDDIEDNGSDHA